MAARFYFRDSGAPKPNKGILLGICALIRKGDALLMEHRADADRWGLIGGALDLDESLQEGLAREIREETGLEMTSCTLFGTFSDPSRIIAYPDGNVIRSVIMAYLWMWPITPACGSARSPGSSDGSLRPSG